MDDHVYKQIKLTGTSTESMEDAVQNAVAKATKTVRNMRWFQLTDTRGTIDGDKVSRWQVTVEIGFTLEN